MKGVFDISAGSRYDDLIVERHHFPSNYRRVAEECVGDWIVYRETGSERGRKAYLAAAFVERIDADSTDPSHFYARVSHFQPFDHVVSYRDAEGRFAERFLRELPDKYSPGLALRGRSIRLLENADFVAIVNEGLSETLAPQNARRLDFEPHELDPVTRSLISDPPPDRKIEQILLNRKVRDAAFRGHVLRAYDETCAVTGIRMINGGGRAEAQAAHIWAVADGGPDTIQNGIALSATAHWLFDRHMISLDDSYRLLVAHNRVPTELRQLFPPSGEPIRLPKNPQYRPRLDYIARHRDKFVNG